MNSFAKAKLRVLLNNWKSEYELSTKEAVDMILLEAIGINSDEERKAILPIKSKYKKILSSKDKTNVISIKVNDELLYVSNNINEYIRERD